MTTNSKMRLIRFLCSMLLIRCVENECQSTKGITFKEYPSKYLIAKPFTVLHIMVELECLFACEANNRCNSLNIKIVEDKKICELLTEDSTTSTLISSSNSNFHEVVVHVKNVPILTRVYCEPECRYFDSCKNSLAQKCRCLSGRILPLQDGKTIMVTPFGNKYASITIDVPNGTYKMKLVFKNGMITCNSWANTNRFGCILKDGTNKILMVVTNDSDDVLLPGPNGYSHDGAISNSNFVIFNDPIQLTKGKIIRIWHKEDLNDSHDTDNAGVIFINVVLWEQQ